MIAVADLIESYGELVDATQGDLIISRGLTTPIESRRITDAYLMDVRGEGGRSPSRASIVPVTFTFLTASPSL